MLRKMMCLTGMLGVLALPLFAQDQKLGDDYAKAALLAVKAIRANVAAAGDSAATTAVQDKIDRAEVEASTPEERANSKALNRLNREHTLNFALVRVIAEGYGGDFRHFSEDKTVVAINKAEADCFDAYEEALRARALDVPKTCDSIIPPSKSKRK